MFTEAQVEEISKAADRAIAWLVSTDTKDNIVTDSRGQEIVVGSIIRAKGSKIDRVVQSILHPEDGITVVVADRVDNKNCVNWRSWLYNTKGMTVVK